MTACSFATHFGIFVGTQETRPAPVAWELYPGLRAAKGDRKEPVLEIWLFKGQLGGQGKTEARHD
jgi:hypothetical protein